MRSALEHKAAQAGQVQRCATAVLLWDLELVWRVPCRFGACGCYHLVGLGLVHCRRMGSGSQPDALQQHPGAVLSIAMPCSVHLPVQEETAGAPSGRAQLEVGGCTAMFCFPSLPTHVPWAIGRSTATLAHLLHKICGSSHSMRSELV